VRTTAVTTAAASVANIGPREARKRRLMGIAALTAGVGLAFLSVIFQAPRVLRLIVFFPIWIAGLGLFQARDRVCIALAARGLCNLDTGEETISDQNLIAKLRDRARSINRRALITAGLITALTFAFPW
jgi:hypothetical protein